MTHNFHWIASFARLKEGVSLDEAKPHMNVIGARIERDIPDSNKGLGVVVERYADAIVGQDTRTALLLLMIASGMMLLIRCANLANLALARGVSREREIAIRTSHRVLGSLLLNARLLGQNNIDINSKEIWSV